MPDVNEFDAVIHSLGEHVVSYVGSDNLRSVRIWSDELSGTADISIVLADESWDAESRAIERMLQVREVFLDELSFDYRFDPAESVSRVGSTKVAALQVA